MVNDQLANKAIEDIEVHDAELVKGDVVASKMNECVPGTLCEVGDYFEMISVCKICGRLS